MMNVAVPPKLSAESTAEFLATLRSKLDGAERSAVGPLILRGSGETFCDGLDLDDAGLSGPKLCDVLSDFVEVLLVIRTGAIATIAVVDGRASGGGVGLAAACDIVVATSEARFSLPEVVWGLTPAIIAPLLAERASAQKLRAMMLEADWLSAREAAAVGLVDRLCASHDLDVLLRRLSRRLVRGDPSAIAGVKRLGRSAAQLRDLLEQGATETERRLSEGPFSARRRAWLEGGVPWAAED